MANVLRLALAIRPAQALIPNRLVIESAEFLDIH